MLLIVFAVTFLSSCRRFSAWNGMLRGYRLDYGSFRSVGKGMLYSIRRKWMFGTDKMLFLIKFQHPQRMCFTDYSLRTNGRGNWEYCNFSYSQCSPEKSTPA
jgi:hypothetical protein